jgi:hypothetical protein
MSYHMIVIGRWGNVCLHVAAYSTLCVSVYSYVNALQDLGNRCYDHGP